MTDELEYQEPLEQTIPKNAFDNFINDLKETYQEEFGWIIKNVSKTEIDSENIKVSLTLEKYKMETTKTR